MARISVPWSQVIDRISVGGRSCMRATRAACRESASLRGGCTNRTIRVWRSTRVPIAERWLLLVFGDGEHYLPRPKSSRGWFAAAVARSNVQAITPHDLRHSCASRAISSGVNVLALARMLGHQSAKVTLDTYSDLFDADLDVKCAQSVLNACLPPSLLTVISC